MAKQDDIDRSTNDWYKDAIVYELHVRAFQDSNGDGIGDFPGLTSRLDYLHDLGVTALWLLPFYPSPLRDDGYDIADYRTVHPDYGTLADFRVFVREAHARGLRVITELVINHTSEQHPWFQRARRAPHGSRYRNWYVWSDDPQRYNEARIIFQDFERSNWAWDEVAGAYYWHRFYSQQPDLNFENLEVQREITRLIDYWLDLGVDGLRLDAIPYLFEQDGTNCENLPATHGYLKQLRSYIDTHYPDRMLLAEANQWPEDAVAYFGDGDECHMCFHFPLMPRLFMAVKMEDRYPVIDILQQTPAIPDGCQWALFLRNHDELTLEMVTDEERDYMYRTYARDRQARINLGIRRRLAPLLEHDRNRIELMNALLLSLPGTPVLYYGDEIGMGDNVYLGDRNGVRTPMQWSADRNAGFSTANPQRLYLPPVIDPNCHYEAVNVETQAASTSSQLWWMRHLLATRSRLGPVLGRGALEFLSPDNSHVLAYLRTHGTDVVLIVANLSRHAQYAELDLSRFAGTEPVELFGPSPFPRIGEMPYPVTLAPYGFYWLSIPISADVVAAPVPQINIAARSWKEIFGTLLDDALADSVARFLPQQNWFGGKDRSLRQVVVTDVVPLTVGGTAEAAVVVIEASYATGDPERYVVPLAVLIGDNAAALERTAPGAIVARLARRGQAEALLCDAMVLPETTLAIVELVRRPRPLRSTGGAEIRARATRELRATRNLDQPSEVHLSRGAHANATAAVSDQLLVKVFRKLDIGVNPEVEVGIQLTDRRFESVPQHRGDLEIADRGERATIAVISQFVTNESDAWTRARDDLGLVLERAMAASGEGSAPAMPNTTNRALVDAANDETADDSFTHIARMIGTRLGAMHRALADHRGVPGFMPEPHDRLYQRSLQQSLRNHVQRTLTSLERNLKRVPEQCVDLTRAVVAAREELLGRITAAARMPLSGQRIRIHGDLHLGQVLWTGRDVTFIDLEGQTLESIGERRLKRSPLRDVAYMLRSLDYATGVARERLNERGLPLDQLAGALIGAQRQWYATNGTALLHAYLAEVEGSSFAYPTDEVVLLLDTFCLDKALHEVTFEMRNRPEWMHIPLRSVIELTDLSHA